MGDTASTARSRTIPTRWLQLLQPFWSITLAVIVAVFVWRQRPELSQAIHELRLADWHWLIAVVVSAVLVHGLLTQTLSSVFLRIGRRIPFVPAVMTHVEREMISTVMPFGGAASYLTLVSRFGAYGVDRNDAMLAVMLYSVIGHLSFITVAVPAMALLIARHDATGTMMLGTVAVLTIAVVLLITVMGLLRGMRFPDRVESRLPSFVREFRGMAESTSVPLRTLLIPFSLALAADLLGVLSLWAALQAVRAGAGFELALGAYVVGTIVLLAAPVFQGLGIVEISVIFLLERHGIALPLAIGATVLYRFVDVWIPVVLGIGVHARYQKVLRGVPAYLPALWSAFSGALALASVLPPTVHIPLVDLQRAGGYGMLHPYHAGRTFTLVAGFLLLVLAVRLVRGLHMAWMIALLLSGLLTMLYLLREFDDVGALISGTNILILLIYRSRFRVRSDIPTLRRGFAVLVVSFSATYLFGVLSLWLAEKRHFGREFSLASSFRTAGDIYLGFSDGGLVARTSRGEWIIDSMHLLGVLSIVVSALALLQPIVWRTRVQRSETEQARQFIEQFGDSSLDRFKYWPDKHQFFASNGNGVVSYGLYGHVALVLGDPTAPNDEALGQTLDEFLDFCEVNGWEPAFHQVAPAHLRLYGTRGLTPILIGREAVVSLADFTLSGKSMGSFRSARNRALREGRRVEYVQPPLSDELVHELKEVSDDWLTLDGRRERTFTLGQFEAGYLRESPVLVLRSAEGRAEAFINLIPDGAPGELTFDLMRHRTDVPNGAMDLLMLALIEYGKAHGYTSLSLGMVPFVNPETEEAGATTDRLVAHLARPMGHFFASESLFAYKDKFHPRWEPRYLVVQSLGQVPRTALALTRLSEQKRHRIFVRRGAGNKVAESERLRPEKVSNVP